VALLIAALYVGREVFVPVALAILLSFVLAPLIRLLQRVYVPRALAVVAVVLIAFAGISVLAGMMATQVTQLAGDLPRYQSTMREKISSLRGSTAGSGALERAAGVLQDLGKELDKPQATTARPTNPLSPQTTSGEVKPVPVELRQPDPGALQTLGVFITPLVHPLATTGIVVIFVIFILLQREDLRNRLIRLAGTHDLQKTTAALDDAAARLSRLFLIQLALNAAFGLVIGVGLWGIGVPNPVLGHSRRRSSFRAVHRRLHLCRFSACARSSSRSWLVDADLDGRAVYSCGADSGTRHRTPRLRSLDRALTSRRCSFSHLLDLAVGASWSRACNTSDCLPRRARTAC